MSNLKLLNRYCWIIVSGLLFFVNQANAQGCCSPGTMTSGGVEQGIANHQVLSVRAGFHANLLNDTYEGTQRIDDPLDRTASASTLNLDIEYGLTDKVSLVANINHATKRRELTVQTNPSDSQETVNFKGDGFGDIILLVKYQLLRPSFSLPLEIGIGGGAKLPTGSYEEESGGSRLAIDLQPGTGATDLLGWAFILKSFPRYQLRFYGNVLYRYSGTNFDNYRFGDDTLISIGSEYGLLEFINISLQMKSRFAREDFSNGRILSGTGGNTFAIVPALTYREGKGAIRLYYHHPFYRNLNGIQLTQTRLVGLEIQYAFDFSDNFTGR